MTALLSGVFNVCFHKTRNKKREMFQNVDDILLVRSHLVFITSSKYHGDSYINSYCGKCCIHFIIVHATKNVVQEMLCLRCYFVYMQTAAHNMDTFQQKLWQVLSLLSDIIILHHSMFQHQSLFEFFGSKFSVFPCVCWCMSVPISVGIYQFRSI